MLGDWEIPRVADMQTLEQRSFVEFDIPGKVGSVFQAMNNLPMHLVISGSLYGGEGNNEFLKKVREQYNKGEPVTFVTDIVVGAELQYVIIKTMGFQINANNPEQLDYYLELKESPPPAPPSSSGFLDDLDSNLLAQAGALVDTVGGALDVLEALSDIPDFGDPSAPLKATLSEVEDVVGDLDEITLKLGGLF